MKMYVYMNRRMIVVETNLAWAIPYWAKRKQNNPNLTWAFS